MSGERQSTIESKERRKLNGRQRLLIAGSAAALAANLVGCTTAGAEGGPDKAQEYSLDLYAGPVNGVEISPSAIEKRKEVLEFCIEGIDPDTGEMNPDLKASADAMKKIWDEGFRELDNLEWSEALAYQIDFVYDPDPTLVADASELVNSSIMNKAENCEEAVFIAAHGIELTNPIELDAKLDAYRANPDPQASLWTIHDNLKKQPGLADEIFNSAPIEAAE